MRMDDPEFYKLTEEQIKIKNLKDTYFAFVNSNAPLWFPAWGLMAIIFGVSLIATHSPQEK